MGNGCDAHWNVIWPSRWIRRKPFFIDWEKIKTPLRYNDCNSPWTVIIVGPSWYRMKSKQFLFYCSTFFFFFVHAPRSTSRRKSYSHRIYQLLPSNKRLGVHVQSSLEENILFTFSNSIFYRNDRPNALCLNRFTWAIGICIPPP